MKGRKMDCVFVRFQTITNSERPKVAFDCCCINNNFNEFEMVCSMLKEIHLY